MHSRILLYRAHNLTAIIEYLGSLCICPIRPDPPYSYLAVLVHLPLVRPLKG